MEKKRAKMEEKMATKKRKRESGDDDDDDDDEGSGGGGGGGTRPPQNKVRAGHARKMAARLRENGYSPMYYENIEGGHGGAADNAQRADMSALEFAFLWRNLARR